VDFVTEKMLLTEHGKLKQLPSDISATIKYISEPVADYSQLDRINDTSEFCNTVGSIEGHSMEYGTITDVDKGKRHRMSFVTPPLRADINKSPSQRHNLERRNLDFFRDRCRKIMLLCSFLTNLYPSHDSLQLLNSAEQVLDGRPVRLTEKTFKLIESALKNSKPETNEYNIDPSTETRIFGEIPFKIDGTLRSTGVSDDCREADPLMKCKYLSSLLHKIRAEDKSYIQITNLSKLITSSASNLSTVQRKEEIQGDMDLNTEIKVNCNSVYDFNCSKRSTIFCNVQHGIKHYVYDANDPNKVSEYDENRTRNSVDLNGRREKKLCMVSQIRNPSCHVCEYFILSTKQSGKELEMMSRLNFSEEHAQEQYVLLTKKTDGMKVANKKLYKDQVSDFKLIPRVLENSEQNVKMKQVSKGKCFLENRSRKNETGECYNLIKMKEHGVSFAPGKTSESMAICSRKDIYLQYANHPVQVISACEHSELQLEDEASYKKCFQRKTNKYNAEGIHVSYSTKAMEIFTNGRNPSRAEKNYMNNKQTDAVLVDLCRNDNIPMKETEDEDSEFRQDHIWQKSAEILEIYNPVNVTCKLKRINNMSSYTSLPQILPEPHENDPLKLNIKCGQREATYISHLIWDTFDLKNRVGTSAASHASNNDISAKSTIFTELEDLKTSSSNDYQGQVFHFWPSNSAFESQPVDVLNYYAAIDFDTVLAAPNLEEVLSKLDQALLVTK
jgi:hypothetical protein